MFFTFQHKMSKNKQPLWKVSLFLTVADFGMQKGALGREVIQHDTLHFNQRFHTILQAVQLQHSSKKNQGAEEPTAKASTTKALWITGVCYRERERTV